MIKALVFISAVLVFNCPAYEGLECYNCYSDSSRGMYDYQLDRCNDQNLTASTTTICPSPKSKCIYEVLENEYVKGSQIWRTCSNPAFEPCDPKSAPNGFKMLECFYCDTDRCNLHKNKTEKNTFTININGSISVSIL